MPTFSSIPSSSLAAPELESPSSSVFDLPSLQPVTTTTNRTPSPLLILSDQTPATDCHDPSFLVVSGGTGCNSICGAFADKACYVLPVSDDGGSSSEIIRVLGGPSIGDIRSRLVRLIPEGGPGLAAIKHLLAYRLPADCTEREARDQWRDIVEGRSSLWNGIANDKKEVIRGFLVHFESEILKRAHKSFSFRNGSVGNYFLAAAQMFFRSLPSAIFLFSSITNSRADILPVIVTNHTVTIAAELDDGQRIVGQCEISHPVALSPSGVPSFQMNDHTFEVDDQFDVASPTIAKSDNAMFAKASEDEYQSLPSRINRLYYINAYAQEIHPPPNPDVLARLATADVLVYSCGSLWTSIIPCLALRGMAQRIARSSSLRAKVLLLNSRNDRETDGYTATDYIIAITQTLNARYHNPHSGLARGNVDTTYPISAFITHIVYMADSQVELDVGAVTGLGVRCVQIPPRVEGDINRNDAVPQFTAESVREALRQILAEDNE